MRSIRVSLVAYFLVLLALGLGAFSFYMHESSRHRLETIYQETADSLASKNARTEALLEESHEVLEQNLWANLDDTVLRRAQQLASHLARLDNSRPRRSLVGHMSRSMAVAMTELTLPGAPMPGGFGLQFQVQQCARDEICRSLAKMRLTSHDLRLIEILTLGGRDTPFGDYFQIFNEHGDSLIASPSLGTDGLPLTAEDWNLKLFDSSKCKDVVLSGNRRVRQVTLKVPIVQMTWQVFEWRPPSRNGPRSPPPTRTALLPADRAEIERGEAPIVFIQYARPTAEIEEALAEQQAERQRVAGKLYEELEATLSELDEQSRATLATLKTRLLLISLATFAATLLGGVWLVHRVLRPVGRITDAVSQVSERDFHLRMERTEVPEELVPIVDKLRESLESLEKAFTREKQAVADISHELRTPVASLLATIQVCLRKSRTPDEYRNTLTTCKDIGDQLNLLVERLLTLARIDAGADKVRAVPVDVPELTEQCMNMIRPLAEERDLTLRMKRNGSVVVQTDADKLREVVTNLLHNAIQYNKPNGRVDVSVDRLNGHVQLEVRDTGIGIGPEVKSHLFERFYRADPSRNSEDVHAGLGLAIVKGYLDLMGGSIEVESEEGRGSTFRVLLPAGDGPHTAK
jgi:heavy metal sensor kinase